MEKVRVHHQTGLLLRSSFQTLWEMIQVSCFYTLLRVAVDVEG